MYIYVLQLRSEKYYIGKTSNYNKRLSEHFDGTGADWTKLHKPKSVVFVVEIYDPKDPNCTKIEDSFTQAFMFKYGDKNVRGGQYCQVNGNYSHITKFLKLYSSEKELEKYLKPKEGHQILSSQYKDL